MLVTVFSLASKQFALCVSCINYQFHIYDSQVIIGMKFIRIFLSDIMCRAVFCTCLTFCVRFRLPFSSSLFMLCFFVCMVRCVYMVHVIKIQQIKVTPSIHPSILQHERESVKGSDGGENSNSDTQWNTE